MMKHFWPVSLIILIISVIVLLSCDLVSVDSDYPWGQFQGRVVAEWLPDHRSMKLEEDFAYIDAYDKVWAAPKGSIVNGASIPQAFWSLVGGPFEGEFRNASVVHDVACEEQTEPWEETARMFYRAMRCSGVPNRKAKVMYFAVYKFGPRWTRSGLTLPQIQPPTSEQVEKIDNYIEDQNPSLKEIREEISAATAATILIQSQ